MNICSEALQFIVGIVNRNRRSRQQNLKYQAERLFRPFGVHQVQIFELHHFLSVNH